VIPSACDTRIVGDFESDSAVPRGLRLDEPSQPQLREQLPQTILTLSSEDIARFFVRVRRDQDSERWDVRLDAALREILERANDFVPSESGGILLDDPRAKLAGSPAPRLTFIASFGPGGAHRLSQRVPSDRGFCGQVYRSGRPLISDSIAVDDPLAVLGASAGRVQSIIGVPVIVGESICGVLELTNRGSGGSYNARDKELLRIFAAYMSSSIQNALDAIRNRTLARMDDLTGLFNSRYFHIRLEDELARADRDGSELSLLFIDLDQFKLVNDRFGHLAGSAILREVARAMTEHAPPASVLARYGGDEFVAALPGAKLAQALAAAETLRRAIESASPSVGFETTGSERRPRVTASLGVASYRDHLAPGGTAHRRENALLRLADAAMYRAKANGRNRVEMAEDED
jgi:diguanylate cyclase (GGDEF)-like protein